MALRTLAADSNFAADKEISLAVQLVEGCAEKGIQRELYGGPKF